MSVLEFQNISKSFPQGNEQRLILDKINLSINKDDFVVISGPSGSGKSTLLHIAAAIEAPSSGTVMQNEEVINFDNQQSVQAWRESIGLVFQRFHLLPYRSVLENVLFRYRYAKEKPTDRHEHALAILERLGLIDRAKQATRLLSGGEMQRVALARALVNQPQLLIADEPSGNLDAENTEQIIALFQELNREGLSILLATHDESFFSTRHASLPL